MRKRNNLVKKEFRENYKKYIEDLKKRSKEFSEPVSEKFSDLPLSKETLRGLRDNGYVTMTEIQRKAIFLALKGRDILGAAKTGSGKTLCFLIPILEDLLKHYWSPIFGLGALVITPTRELAYQIFEVLRKIGKQHHFSAGLVIGGKDLSAEQQLISRMCILICTPGRLLQHMDETELFELKELRILVLDEADRILDLGFEKTVNAIIATLPKRRQTLLFSATQTKSVKDLARLSLQDAEYVAVYEQPQVLTPSKLTQNYIFCELSSKLKILYSFLRSHTRMKLLVFVSSCKQVRFIYEAFRRLRCGLPLLELHGKQKQPKRMSIYDEFCRRRFACLIATDIAARGLDFPSIHWVLQVDCPEDANTYIHRVGRTARYESGGNALLFLLPSEKAFLKLLQEKKVPISELQLNPRKIKSITANLAALCAEHPDIKYLAQKYFVSYIRSVFLQANKKVFDVSSLSLDEFSVSLGLSQPPKVRCVKQVKDGKNKCRQASQPDTTTPTAEKVGLNEEIEDDLFVVKASAENAFPPLTEEEIRQITNGKDGFLTRKKASKFIGFGSSIKFDAEEEDAGGINLSKQLQIMTERDKDDKEKQREAVKRKHREKRQKLREQRRRLGSLHSPQAVLLSEGLSRGGSPCSDAEIDNHKKTSLEEDETLALSLLQGE